MVIIYEENTSQSLSHHLPVSNEIHYLYFFDHACLHSGLHSTEIYYYINLILNLPYYIIIFIVVYTKYTLHSIGFVGLRYNTQQQNYHPKPNTDWRAHERRRLLHKFLLWMNELVFFLFIKYMS